MSWHGILIAAKQDEIQKVLFICNRKREKKGKIVFLICRWKTLNHHIKTLSKLTVNDTDSGVMTLPFHIYIFANKETLVPVVGQREPTSLLFCRIGEKMRLQNPQTNIAAIRQDYKDKHASGGALFAGRKYDRQVRNKDGKFIFEKDGSPKMYRPYIQSRQLITDEDMLVQESFKWSEDYENDCYCSINSFPANCTARTADNVATLTGFYIDFDHIAIHTLAKKQQATPELLINFVLDLYHCDCVFRVVTCLSLFNIDVVVLVAYLH